MKVLYKSTYAPCYVPIFEETTYKMIIHYNDYEVDCVSVPVILCPIENILQNLGHDFFYI